MAEKAKENFETEVKFQVDDEAIFNTLKTLEQLGDFQLVPVGTKIVADSYLDTAGKHFMQAGYACRIRKVKQKLTLTLKSLTPPDGAIHRREEFESFVDSVDPAGWPTNETTTKALTIAAGESLQTLFVLRQTRHKYNAHLGGQPVLEFSLDAVWHTAGDEVDYFELEAELIKTGTEADLTRFVDVLQAGWDLPLESRSKFERAYIANFET